MLYAWFQCVVVNLHTDLVYGVPCFHMECHTFSSWHPLSYLHMHNITCQCYNSNCEGPLFIVLYLFCSVTESLMSEQVKSSEHERRKSWMAKHQDIASKNIPPPQKKNQNKTTTLPNNSKPHSLHQQLHIGCDNCMQQAHTRTPNEWSDNLAISRCSLQNFVPHPAPIFPLPASQEASSVVISSLSSSAAAGEQQHLVVERLCSKVHKPNYYMQSHTNYVWMRQFFCR